MVQIQICNPRSPSAVKLLDNLSATLADITGDSGQSSFDTNDVSVARSVFVMAHNASNIPVGCGAYRPLSEQVAEIKRMYASPGSNGVGAAILTYLEERALGDDYSEIWLETRLVNLRAIAFYERHGYCRIPNYGKYEGRPEAVCFAKTL